MEAGDVDGLVLGLARDAAAAAVEPTDRVMLDYAIKLTRTPCEIGLADVERLRSAGFDDRAVHDICAIAAYYAFVNRIADGLGVELEARFSR
jgi:uncharacterized peroxidase-related enzyme